jgi:hypothetical protein
MDDFDRIISQANEDLEPFELYATQEVKSAPILPSIMPIPTPIFTLPTMPISIPLHTKKKFRERKVKECGIDGCKGVAAYNFPGKNPLYCKLHREVGMIFRPLRYCWLCYAVATHGCDKAEFCETHAIKNENYIKCPICGIYVIYLLDGLCHDCFYQKKSLERDEYRIARFLFDNGYRFLYDCATCFGRRVDIFMSFERFNIAIEIDERQHNYEFYNPYSEIYRMRLISLGTNLPIVFIRFNPDNFDGIMEKSERLQKLLDILDLIIKTSYGKDVSDGFEMSDDKKHKLLVHYICYDGYNPDAKEFVVLD